MTWNATTSTIGASSKGVDGNMTAFCIFSSERGCVSKKSLIHEGTENDANLKILFLRGYLNHYSYDNVAQFV
ncbi:MAG: hypothetical protein HGB36_10870 [Chlorobiaceae bacterium]|nr:hypothetical protein [Chlorobiaceae bacterium]